MRRRAREATSRAPPHRSRETIARFVVAKGCGRLSGVQSHASDARPSCDMNRRWRPVLDELLETRGADPHRTAARRIAGAIRDFLRYPARAGDAPRADPL